MSTPMRSPRRSSRHSPASADARGACGALRASRSFPVPDQIIKALSWRARQRRPLRRIAGVHNDAGGGNREGRTLGVRLAFVEKATGLWSLSVTDTVADLRELPG